MKGTAFWNKKPYRNFTKKLQKLNLVPQQREKHSEIFKFLKIHKKLFEANTGYTLWGIALWNEDKKTSETNLCPCSASTSALKLGILSSLYPMPTRNRYKLI